MRVEGSRLRDEGTGFRVQGSRFRVQGSGFSVEDIVPQRASVEEQKLCLLWSLALRVEGLESGVAFAKRFRVQGARPERGTRR